MDYATLQSRQIVALENVQDLTARLAKAQDIFGRITKRLKTMRECQEPPTPPAHSRGGHRNGRDGLSEPRADHHHVQRTFMVQWPLVVQAYTFCCRGFQKKTVTAVILVPQKFCGQ